MRVLLEDAFAIRHQASIGLYTQNLFLSLQRLSPSDNFFLLEKSRLGGFSSKPLRKALYFLWLNTSLQTFLKKTTIQIAHFTNFLVPSFRRPETKYVANVHDLGPWKCPEALSPLYLPYIRWAILRSVQQADLILTASETIKTEILERFGLDEKRVRVAYNGVSRAFHKLPEGFCENHFARLRERLKLRSEFLLFVGMLEQRKNVLTLVKAFSKIREKPDLQLVLAGRPANAYPSLERYIEKKHLKERVIFTGYITEEDLITLYNKAALFVFPSLYEGFGIPLIEAMACGLPIVASKIPSTSEVAEDAVYYYGDPLDENALKEAIEIVMVDDRIKADLIAKGLERAKAFTWEEVAKRHLKFYKELLSL